MDNATIKKLLDKKDYTGTTAAILKDAQSVYAATVGLDNRPQVRPAWFAYERGGALYFLTLKSSRMYAELSKTPYVQFCVPGGEAFETFRLSGKAVFTEDEALTELAASSCPQVLQKAGGDMKFLIVFFLTGASAMIETQEDAISFKLPDSKEAPVGIKIKKKTELRDRLARVFERRESDPPAADSADLKKYDGALLVFAEAAKALWPRMDVRPVERAAVFETYDEREKYTSLASSKIGNAVIDKPEDITYWLDFRKWSEGGEFT